LLLASLDAARQQMATAGQQFLAKTLELSREMRSGLSPLTPVTAISPEDVSSYASVKELDLTRLTVDVSGLGMTGLEADEILHGEHGVTAELPELRHLTFIISLGNTPADGERFLESFKHLRASWVQAGAADPSTLQRLSRAEPPPFTQPQVSPRDAFFAETEVLPAKVVLGRLSAETISPYPPGIPAIVAGEAITAAALDQLKTVHQQGGYLTGCSDLSLETLKVLNL
jgi:arginine decarboxylase